MATRVQRYSFTIASGQALSGTIDLGPLPEFCSSITQATFLAPAGWDAAALTAQVSEDGVTWANVVSSAGAEITILTAVTPSTAAVLSGGTFLGGTRYIRFRSGTGATPVNQTANRTFTLVLMHL